MAKGLKERYVVLSGVKPRASGLSCQRSAMNNVIHIIQEQCDPHSHSDRVISAREVVVGGCRSSVAEAQAGLDSQRHHLSFEPFTVSKVYRW